METILYLCGGIALLALTYLFITISAAVKSADLSLKQVGNDFHALASDVSELKTQTLPVLSDLRDLTLKANAIADGVQSQMVNIHSVIDGALDVVRGTIDDAERLKNDVVDLVQGPISLVKSSSASTIGLAIKGMNLLTKLLNKGKHSTNGSVKVEFRDSPDEAEMLRD
jgi:uncharacterized protein YoxC